MNNYKEKKEFDNSDIPAPAYLGLKVREGIEFIIKKANKIFSNK